MTHKYYYYLFDFKIVFIHISGCMVFISASTCYSYLYLKHRPPFSQCREEEWRRERGGAIGRWISALRQRKRFLFLRFGLLLFLLFGLLLQENFFLFIIRRQTLKNDPAQKRKNQKARKQRSTIQRQEKAPHATKNRRQSSELGSSGARAPGSPQFS